jgi:hypothetical protein
MAKLFTVMGLWLIATPSYAGWGQGQINRFYVDSNGSVYFGLTAPLDATCSYFSDHFRFDASTPTGKNMLAVLTAAKVSGAQVQVWYSDSIAPGTEQSNGCDPNTMAVANAIGIP